MAYRADLTKYGIVALAGIAILGWVRESERHESDLQFEHESSARARMTFRPPPDTPRAAIDGNRVAGRPRYAINLTAPMQGAVESGRPRSFRPKKQTVAAYSNDTPQVAGRPAEQAPSNDGRHEAGDTADYGSNSRSREPDGAIAPGVEARAKTGDDPLRTGPSQTDTDTNHGGHTPAVRVRHRSTARSVAIIAGVAAAGAAIGGIAGGGKGAAIGAITGGSGGYVYDRMTRRKTGSVPGLGSGSASGYGSDETGDLRQSDREDRRPTLARRFGTPAFN